MSIKTKIRSLIDAANAKTGKSDTDLTAAVQSLISESGGITPSGNKAITPSETAQSGIDVTNYATVSVGAISSTYVGSGITKKAAATVAPSTSEQTVCASGVYTTGEQKVSAITPSIVGNLDASSFAASIVAAIEGKGVTVPDGAKIDDLAALIESIQTGGAAVEQISFTINDGSEVNTFSVVSGTTFTEWIGTSRVISETSGLTLYVYNDGAVFADEAGVYALSLDGNTAVYGSDTITSGATYTIINWGG